MKCFVVTPIGSEGSEIRKRADQVFKYIIAPTCEKCGFEAVRVDQINQADSITQTIIDMLRSSELVIADMTEHNPNAFYEMGYRACTGKPMINLKQKGESIPFDIASIRAFDYDLTDLDSVEEVKARLEQTIISFNITEDTEKENENLVGERESNDKAKGNADILPILYDIQDQLSRLTLEVHTKNTEIIQAVVRASQPPAVIEDPNTALLKIMLPEILKNPKSFKTLLELSDQNSSNENKRTK